MRRLQDTKLKKIGFVLMILGVMLALYPLSTFLYAQYEQAKLRTAVNMDANPSAGSQTPPEVEENPALEENPAQQHADGEWQGALIEIPAINVSAVVVKGTSRADLLKGPGWYEQSALPGEGNTAIAGHRTMYGAWFRHVDRLTTGDVITLKYAGETYVYRVERVYPVANNDWSVISPCGYPALTLTTCHPVGSAKQRLVVRAALIQRL